MRMLVFGLTVAAALLSVPAVAGASTKGFDVKNDSDYTLKLTEVSPFDGCQSQGCLEDHPPIGAEMKPGASERWELYAPWSGRTGASLGYDVLEGDRKLRTAEIVISYEFKFGYYSMFSVCLPPEILDVACDADGFTSSTNQVTFRTAVAASKTPSCQPDSIRAKIAGRSKCLRVGQLCARAKGWLYRRHRFACVLVGGRHRLVRTCPSSSALAVIGGQRSCLRPGKPCAPAHAQQYRRHGYACVHREGKYRLIRHPGRRRTRH
jgi:hypothetical protein